MIQMSLATFPGLFLNGPGNEAIISHIAQVHAYIEHSV